MFNTDGPQHANQGNKAIAQHSISREKVPRGPEGHRHPDAGAASAKCGAENMVPVWMKGKEPWFCIDVLRVPEQGLRAADGVDAAAARQEGVRAPGQAPLLATSSGTSPAAAIPKAALISATPTATSSISTSATRTCATGRRVWSQNARTTWKTCTTDTEPSGSVPEVPLTLRCVRSAWQRRRGHDAPRGREGLSRSSKAARGSTTSSRRSRTSPSPRRRRTRPALTPITATSTRAGTWSRSRQRCT